MDRVRIKALNLEVMKLHCLLDLGTDDLSVPDVTLSERELGLHQLGHARVCSYHHKGALGVHVMQSLIVR